MWLRATGAALQGGLPFFTGWSCELLREDARAVLPSVVSTCASAAAWGLPSRVLWPSDLPLVARAGREAVVVRVRVLRCEKGLAYKTTRKAAEARLAVEALNCAS